MVQPAGPAGERRVFVTIAFEEDESSRQVEFVLTERGANQLAEALASGTVGISREFDFPVDGPDLNEH